jgi:hypothetical protein
MGRLFKRLLGLGVLAGAAYAIWRAWNARVPQQQRDLHWETAPFPFPPAPRPAAQAPAVATEVREDAPPKAEKKGEKQRAPWVEPKADGTCPASHPIKAKVKSGIYHEPGGANYDRTKPDRCYLDAATAEADGLRRSKV